MNNKHDCTIDLIQGSEAAVIFAHTANGGIIETTIRINAPYSKEDISNALEAMIFQQINYTKPDRIVINETTETLMPDSARIYMTSAHIPLAILSDSEFTSLRMKEGICRQSANMRIKYGRLVV